MARDRFKRKSLKEDVVQDALFNLIDWGFKRRRWLIAGVSAVLIVVAAGFGYTQYSESRARNEAESYAEIGQDASKKQLSSAEREESTRARYEAFIADYPNSTLTPPAWMNLARIAWNKGNLIAARKAFQAVIDHPKATLPQKDLSVLGLARLAEKNGDLTKAEGYFNSLSEPTYGDLKAYHLGRIAAARKDTKTARQHFEKVSRGQPGSTLAEWARQNLDFNP